MNREEITRMAQDCDLGRVCGPLDTLLDHEWEDLHRFASLIAAAEREACAKVCEDNRYEGYVPPEDGAAADYYNDASRECAAAIRARSNT